MAVDKFSQERVYRTQAPGAQVLAELDNLRGLDARHEQRESWASRVGCGSFIGAVVLFFVVGLNGRWEDPSLEAAALWSILLLVVTGIVAYVLRSRFARFNLENRRYELATRLVEMVQADTAPQEPLTLEMDLEPTTHPRKFTGEGKTRAGWNVKFHADRWLSLQARLLDGTRLHVEVTERTDVRSRSKISASGKLKTKRKILSDMLIRVRLQVKPEKYPHLGRLGARAREAVRLPRGSSLKSLSVQEDRLDITSYVDGPWDVKHDTYQVNAVHLLALTLLSLYQLLNLSRALDKKAANS